MSELADAIHALDVRQGGPNAVWCANDQEHGRLTVHGTSRALVCGAKECNYHVLVDQATIVEALAELEL
jgi:hypothetical protein